MLQFKQILFRKSKLIALSCLDFNSQEVTKTHNTVEHEDTAKYRQLLVRTLHSCCIKFPEISASVIPALTEFLSDTNELAAADVLIFIREAIHKFEALRPLIIEKLLEAFPSIK